MSWLAFVLGLTSLLLVPQSIPGSWREHLSLHWRSHSQLSTAFLSLTFTITWASQRKVWDTLHHLSWGIWASKAISSICYLTLWKVTSKGSWLFSSLSLPHSFRLWASEWTQPEFWMCSDEEKNQHIMKLWKGIYFLFVWLLVYMIHGKCHLNILCSH